MASRTIYAGDSFPPILLQVSDETGVLDMSGATSLSVKFDGKTHQFTQTGVAIQPPTVDPDGIHTWNLQCNITTANTSQPDAYNIFVVVTWSAGEIETFATGDVLTVLTAPT